MMKSFISLIPPSDKIPASKIEASESNNKINENLLFVLTSLIGLCLLRVSFAVILIIIVLVYMLYINSISLATTLIKNSSFSCLFGDDDEENENDADDDMDTDTDNEQSENDIEEIPKKKKKISEIEE